MWLLLVAPAQYFSLHPLVHCSAFVSLPRARPRLLLVRWTPRSFLHQPISLPSRMQREYTNADKNELSSLLSLSSSDTECRPEILDQHYLLDDHSCWLWSCLRCHEVVLCSHDRVSTQPLPVCSSSVSGAVCQHCWQSNQPFRSCSQTSLADTFPVRRLCSFRVEWAQWRPVARLHLSD